MSVVRLFTSLFPSLTYCGVGTDMHSPQRGVNGWTTIIANFTEEAILDQLIKRRTSVISQNLIITYQNDNKLEYIMLLTPRMERMESIQQQILC